MYWKPCFILSNWKHKAVPPLLLFGWVSWVWTPYSFIYTNKFCAGVFCFPQTKLHQIIAIISQSSPPTLAPLLQSRLSQTVWGYRLCYPFTTSAHTVHVKTAAGIGPCTSAAVGQRWFRRSERRTDSYSGPSKAAALSNPLTKWMDCFGNTGLKFHCPTQTILFGKPGDEGLVAAYSYLFISCSRLSQGRYHFTNPPCVNIKERLKVTFCVEWSHPSYYITEDSLCAPPA